MTAYTRRVPKQRGHGEGSWRRRSDGRVELRLTIDGRPVSRYLPRSSTDRDARRALRDAANRAERGDLIGTGRQSMREFLGLWIADVAPNRLRPRTLERYAGIVQKHLVPAIGHVQLERLSSQHIDRLHATCRASMSASSVRSVHAVLRSALRYAVERRLIDRNPADAAPPPRAPSTEIQALDVDECRQLLEAIAGDPLEALYVLALTTGMRLGELLGLRWEDVDLAEGAIDRSPRVAVRHGLIRTKATWALAAPKTRHSVRSIVLGGRAVRALQSHSTAQKRRRLAAGQGWADHDLVFTDDWGEPLYGGHITERHLKPLLRRAGLPAIRFHDLRHSAATLMLGQGVNPKIVSEMLGHAGVQITLDRYSHVMPNMQAIVAAKMDEALG